MKPYPIFLVHLADKRCVVLGGGAEAERKVLGLVECDAEVTVIAATIGERLRGLAEERKIQWLARDFQTGDLRGAFLVVSTDRAVHEQAWQEAEAEGALINAVDDTAHSNFIAGSVVRQGPLVLAISTSGCAPAFAVRLRERLEQELGPEYAAFLDLMAEVRDPLAAKYPDFLERREKWYALVDSDVLEHLRAGRSVVARRRVEEIAGFRDFPRRS